MAKKRDYAVGRGKPPVHTQYQKGQSGNPSGRPKKTIRVRLRETLEEALKLNPDYLSNSAPEDALASTIKTLTLAAIDGDLRAIKYLFTLAQECESSAAAVSKAPAGQTKPEADSNENEVGIVTLPQGKEQGSLESAADPGGNSETVDDVGAEQPAETAKIEEDEAPPEPPPVQRPKRPTIWIGGELVQQGD